jgi:IS605 OrfB family transposase
MIRSSKVSLKFSNLGKRETLEKVTEEYKKVTQFFVDTIWDFEKIPTLLPKEITSLVETRLSARLVQCCAKQASGIVRGTKQKSKQRLFVIEKLKKEGKLKEASKLQVIQDRFSLSNPRLETVCPELDSRFCSIELDKVNSFDGWLVLTSLGNKIKLELPFKRTKHFNSLLEKGKLKAGVRLTNKSITFMFELKDVSKVEIGSVLGIDIGILSTISCSNGFQTQKNLHGYGLNKILEIMSRKKKGSKAFKRSVEHRKNYTNWSINQLNLKGVKQVNIENIKDLRRGKRSSKKLSHWIYKEISGKLESVCEQLGVLVVRKNPTYTSQRCSVCGWTQRTNRNGKLFSCKRCKNTCDADFNASVNISLDLPCILKEERLKRNNIKGFYWCVSSQEPIAPGVQKTLEDFS